MRLYAGLAAALLWAASLFGAYVKGQHVGEDRVTAQQAREDQVVAVAIEAAASAAAQAISRIKVQNTTIKQRVERETATNTVYRDPGCVHPPGVLRDINEALTGAAGPEPAGSGKLPGANAAR